RQYQNHHHGQHRDQGGIVVPRRASLPTGAERRHFPCARLRNRLRDLSRGLPPLHPRLTALGLIPLLPLPRRGILLLLTLGRVLPPLVGIVRSHRCIP